MSASLFRRLICLPVLAFPVLLAACEPVSLTVASGAATVGTAAAEERGISNAADDLRIKASINDLWFQADHEIFMHLTATVREGRAQITGSVPKADDRITAIKLAWQAKGVKQVLDEIQVEDTSGFTDYARDVRIANDLRGRMLLDKQIRNINYTVSVVNSVVYLMGIAQSPAEIDRVLAHARDISGVRRVVNHVVLRDDPRRTEK